MAENRIRERYFVKGLTYVSGRLCSHLLQSSS